MSANQLEGCKCRSTQLILSKRTFDWFDFWRKISTNIDDNFYCFRWFDWFYSLSKRLCVYAVTIIFIAMFFLLCTYTQHTLLIFNLSSLTICYVLFCCECHWHFNIFHSTRLNCAPECARWSWHKTSLFQVTYHDSLRSMIFLLLNWNWAS